MDIEVGEYIRTKKDGKIDKLYCKIDKNSWQSKNTFGDIIAKCQIDRYLLEDIAKHSKNLLDLIEIGDIVEVLVNKRTNEILRYTLDTESDLYLLRKDTVKTILTHEQYERNCYRLEG